VEGWTHHLGVAARQLGRRPHVFQHLLRVEDVVLAQLVLVLCPGSKHWRGRAQGSRGKAGQGAAPVHRRTERHLHVRRRTLRLHGPLQRHRRQERQPEAHQPEAEHNCRRSYFLGY